MTAVRSRYAIYASIASLFLLFTTFYWHGGSLNSLKTLTPSFSSSLEDKPPAPAPEPTKEPYRPRYKNATNTKSLPIVDNFPLAAHARSSANLPAIPIWNTPPHPHVVESTPLYIGFTRNWRLLQQVVVGYITAGWPAEDIYVVENTGVMSSNKKGLLSLQNPFFLNHTRLEVLGVNVIVTPTLLTFAQLQNFYIYEATQRGWGHFFWSHMDVVPLSFEDRYEAEDEFEVGGQDPNQHDYSDFTSLYGNCVNMLRKTLERDAQGHKRRWAQRFFSYDRLALVNVEAFLEVGAWDTLIPFYMGDCDMHARLEMAGFVVEEEHPGSVFDVASSLEDLVVLYRHTGVGIPEEVKWKDPNALVGEEIAKEGGNLKRDVEMEIPASQPQNTSLPTTYSASTKPTALPVSHSNSAYTPDTIRSSLFTQLKDTLDRMQGSKGSSSRGRNTWQSRQTGGQGDPFYRDPEGFEQGIAMTIEFGRSVFREKWGHRDCDIAPIGMKAQDAWRVHHDWEPLPEGS